GQVQTLSTTHICGVCGDAGVTMRRHFVRSITSIFAAIALTLSSPTVANADSRAINFEFPTYHTGSIDGQDGWAGTLGSPINPAIDQAVVTNTGYSSFGTQSWRMSNAYTDGAFGDWPFSPSLVNEAGETMALNHNGPLVYSDGTRQNHFDVQWSFAAAVPNSTGTDCSSRATCSSISMS